MPALEWSPLEDRGCTPPSVLYSKKVSLIVPRLLMDERIGWLIDWLVDGLCLDDHQDGEGGEEETNFDPGYEPDWAVISSVKRSEERVPVRNSGRGRQWSLLCGCESEYRTRIN